MNKRHRIAIAVAAVIALPIVVFAQGLTPPRLPAGQVAATAWVQSMKNATAIAELRGTSPATPTATERPATATPTSTPTTRPATATPSPVPPTATPVGPTVTPPAPVAGFDCSIPASERNYVCGAELSPAPAALPNLAGQPCPAYAHDRYIVQAVREPSGEWVTKPAPANIAPDAILWRTWHPNTDAATGCTFQHEHGEQWLPEFAPYNAGPAFGLIGCIHWFDHGRVGENHCSEPHHGFKVQNIAPYRDTTNDGGIPTIYAQELLHMGTTGEGRFTRQHHSVEHWFLMPGQMSRSAHVMGMADFGAFPECRGDLAQRDARLASGQCRVFTAFQRMPQTGPFGYEAWAGTLKIKHPDMPDYGPGDPGSRVAWDFGVGMNAFEPATGFSEVNGQFVAVDRPGDFGCKDREKYFGTPFYYVRASGIESAWTDAHGEIAAPSDQWAILQIVPTPSQPLSAGIGYGVGEVSAFRDRATVYKDLYDACSPGLAKPN